MKSMEEILAFINSAYMPLGKHRHTKMELTVEKTIVKGNQIIRIKSFVVNYAILSKTVVVFYDDGRIWMHEAFLPAFMKFLELDYKHVDVPMAYLTSDEQKLEYVMEYFS